MKIEEDDLARLFDRDEVTLIPEDTWIEVKSQPQKVGVKKTILKFDHEEIRKVRHQIKNIPHHKESRKSPSGIFELILRLIIFAGISGALAFAVISFPSIWDQLKWYYYTDYLGKSYPAQVALQSTTPTPKPIPSKQLSPLPSPSPFLPPSPVAAVASPAPSAIITAAPAIPSKQEGNYIKIEKISIYAPVLWNVEEANIISDLAKGVAHYKGTSLPGDGGNAVLIGHSSNYPWVKSPYNHVFSLLNKLVIGDRIELRRGTTSYFYEVTSSKVISPKHIEILNTVDRETLTLITCWPIGTNINRLVIEAQLKYQN